MMLATRASFYNLLTVAAVSVGATQAFADAKLKPQQLAVHANCERAYLKFFKSDDLDFRIVFGYKDSRPARLVTDRYERLLMIGKLRALGFVRDDNDDELMRLQIEGPDHLTKRIQLRIVESSVGADDEINRQNPFQQWQSAHALELFQDGIKNGNAIFYVGHSRKGGGPDFSPPRCTKDGHVDYGWYLSDKTALNQTAQAMKQAKVDKILIGLFSCDSRRHFSGILSGISPSRSKKGISSTSIGFVFNKKPIYYIESVNETVSAIQNLITFKCAPESMQPGTQYTNFF